MKYFSIGGLLVLIGNLAYAATDLSIQTLRNFNFGTLYPTNEVQDTITIKPDGSNVLQGAITHVEPAPAEFVVHGTPGRIVVIQMPESMAIDNGDNQIVLKDFSSNLANWHCQLDDTGSCTFTVGATLVVLPQAPIGSHAATGVISANYLMFNE